MNGVVHAAYRCRICNQEMRYEEGVLLALPAERSEYYRKFLSDYTAIRSAEGRGSADPAFYRSLPFCDATDKNAWQWRIRATTYRHLVSRILPRDAMDIADVGAGNCWLSYRMRELGRNPVAVDLSLDVHDGLGAAQNYPHAFPRVQAEFDALPFGVEQFDLVIFNASFHYSTDYHRTLRSALRCLRRGGKIVVLDSPLYRLPEHGEQMKSEKHAEFEARYGTRSDSLPSHEYIHEVQLAELSRDLHLRWTIHQPWYGWQWHLRPLRARFQGKRPPSRFCILVAEPQSI